MKNRQESTNFEGKNAIWPKHLQKEYPKDDFTHEFSIFATRRTDYSIGEGGAQSLVPGTYIYIFIYYIYTFMHIYICAQVS